MHIEPGVVNGAKIGLSYLTGAVALGIGLKFFIKRVFTRCWIAGNVEKLQKNIFAICI